MSLTYQLMDRWGIEEDGTVALRDVLDFADELIAKHNQELESVTDDYEERVNALLNQALSADDEIRSLRKRHRELRREVRNALTLPELRQRVLQ